MAKKDVGIHIRSAVASLAKQAAFTEWVKTDKPKDGLVLVNNSFIYRDKLKTNKNSHYLAIPVTAAGEIDTKNLKVVHGTNFNNDFKFLPARARSSVVTEDLSRAVERELAKLGSIVMVLVGEIEDTVRSSETIGHSLFSAIELDPTAKSAVAVSGKTITIQSASDEEVLWDELQRVHKAPLPSELAEPFATAIEKLRQKDYAILKLPGRARPKVALLDSFAVALRKSMVRYKRSLEVSKGVHTSHANDFNDVLRIAYSFASDAVRVIRLLVSVSDLKPAVRWCTIDDWFRLEDTFRSLPWSKLKQKPSLDIYQGTINAARNRAFHHLLPVNKTLQVDLEGKTLGILRLRLFPEYSSRKNAEGFVYEDKALVEVLTEFTRAGEKAVSPQFWNRNLAVMQSTIDLLDGTSSALKLLAASA
jgi:hypothetical protein